MAGDENTDGYDLDTAESSLANAERSANRSRKHGWRWVRTYLVVWAVASVGLVLGLGVGSREITISFLIAWAILAMVGGIWSRSQGVAPRGGGRRIGRAAGLWAACYGIALAVGLALQAESTWFWLAAALFTATPLLVTALIPAPRVANAY